MVLPGVEVPGELAGSEYLLSLPCPLQRRFITVISQCWGSFWMGFPRVHPSRICISASQRPTPLQLDCCYQLLELEVLKFVGSFFGFFFPIPCGSQTVGSSVPLLAMRSATQPYRLSSWLPEMVCNARAESWHAVCCQWWWADTRQT